MSKTATGKPSWNAKVTAAINKFFTFIKGVIDILHKIVKQLMSTIVFFFMALTKLLTDPTMPCVMAIAWVVIALGVAAFQWWSIGLWFGQVIGTPQILGIGFAAVGLIAGLALNIEQMAPEIWKIWKNLARAFQKLRIDFNHDTSNNDIGDRVNNWHSYDYQMAKKTRLLSYGLETAIVLIYVGVSSFSYISIIIALISLICPEVAIKNLAAKTSVFGEANEIAMADEEGDSSGNSNSNFQMPKGGHGGGFPPQGGRTEKL